MNLKRILVANLAVSSVTLALLGANSFAILTNPADTQVAACSCTCPVEEVEEVEPTEVTEPTETVEPTEPIEKTEPTNLGEFKLTAYCACSSCCGKSDGITATGTIATAGRTIAVDPRVIPYGTEVIINGNTYIAEDCGGSIKGNRIDVFFDSHSEALQFGIQYANVYLANK